MPFDRGREEFGFLGQLGGVVFAEMELRSGGLGGGGLVEGEDVGDGFELGDSDEADLGGCHPLVD